MDFREVGTRDYPHPGLRSRSQTEVPSGFAKGHEAMEGPEVEAREAYDELLRDMEEARRRGLIPDESAQSDPVVEAQQLVSQYRDPSTRAYPAHQVGHDPLADPYRWDPLKDEVRDEYLEGLSIGGDYLDRGAEERSARYRKERESLEKKYEAYLERIAVDDAKLERRLIPREEDRNAFERFQSLRSVGAGSDAQRPVPSSAVEIPLPQQYGQYGEGSLPGRGGPDGCGGSRRLGDLLPLLAGGGNEGDGSGDMMQTLLPIFAGGGKIDTGSIMELAAGAITYLLTNILNEHKEKSGRHETKSRFKKFLISACVSVVTKFLKDKGLESLDQDHMIEKVLQRLVS